MTAPRIGGGHVPIDPGTGLVWGSDGAGNATPVNGAVADQLAVAAGFKGWVAHPLTTGNNSSALTSQSVAATGIWIPAGTVVANVVLGVSTAAGGAAPTGFYVGIAKPDGTMLAQSSNLNGSSSLTTRGYQSFPLASAYTARSTDSATGFYYIVVLQNGTFGTTQPTFLLFATATAHAQGGYGTGPRLIGAQSGRATLPANGSALTLSNTGAAWWVAFA